MFTVYTDGSSTGKQGAAACAALLLFGGKGVLVAKRLKMEAGNNVAELYAVLLAIKELPDGATAAIHTDSKNVIGWLVSGWKRNEKPINDAVKAILELWSKKQLTLTFQHVKGHSGNKYNELVDAAANEAKKTGKVIKQEVTL